jgi:GAF domain-containing protein
VNRIGRLLSAELNLDRLLQAATDAATELTGAQFGAFFYNVIDAKGESYTLYTISGVPARGVFPVPYAACNALVWPHVPGGRDHSLR